MSDDLIARLRKAALPGTNRNKLDCEAADAIESLDSALEAAQQLAMQRGDELIEKDAEIELLTAERDALNDALANSVNRRVYEAPPGMEFNPSGLLDKITSERDALRADAERWRWAKVFVSGDDTPEANARAMALAAQYPLGVKDVDAAIDAARGKA